VWVRAKTRRELQIAINEMLVDVDRRTHVNRNTITVREWADAWLAGLPATGLRDKTVTYYADMTGHIIKQ